MKTILVNQQASTAEYWKELRNYFLDRILIGFLILAVFGIPLSLSRAFFYGWQPLYLIQTGSAIGVILLYLLRRRLPFSLKAGILITDILILSITGLITFGLAGGGVPFLLLLQFLVASIYRPRIALLWFIFLFSAFIAIGAAFASGHIKLTVDFNAYMTNPASWAPIWLLFGVIGIVAFRAMGTMQQTLLTLLKEVEAQRDEIHHLANHDHLTGLPTMRLAQDRLEVAIHHAERHNEKVALFFIDLDGFKQVNDEFGHESGDYALKITAQRMLSIVRAEDTVARRSGDEFLVILGSLTDSEYIADIARRMVTEIAKPIDYHGLTFALGASIGISIFPDNTRNIEDLKELADQAMYGVKNAHKNGFSLSTIFDTTETP